MDRTAIVAIEGEYETALKLLNVTGFNDLEWPLTPISRSRYYSTSKLENDTRYSFIYNRRPIEIRMVYWTAPFSMTLKDPNPDFKVRPFFDTEYL